MKVGLFKAGVWLSQCSWGTRKIANSGHLIPLYLGVSIAAGYVARKGEEVSGLKSMATVGKALETMETMDYCFCNCLELLTVLRWEDSAGPPYCRLLSLSS